MDLYERYLQGVAELLKRIEPSEAVYLNTLTLQGRLAQTVAEIRQFGPTDSARVEIARVLSELDRLSLAYRGESFSRLCGIAELLSERPSIVYQNLPQPDYDRFVGREPEMAKVRELLSPTSRHFLVTIDGIGGIGKSALALEIAHSYLRDVPTPSSPNRFDAIIWTSAKQTMLTGDGVVQRKQVLHTLEDIYSDIAIVLQREGILRAKQAEQSELIRQALTQQRTLLIVDNLETIDDEMVLSFLRELPSPTKSIVTTRYRIDVAYPIRLVGMPWDDARVLISQECVRKAIELNTEQMRRLYDRTGGVPLALVWSVAQVGYGHSIDAVLTQLGRPSGDIAQYCFANAMQSIRGSNAHKLLMALALVSNECSREMLGNVAGFGEDIFGRDEGLAELEKLSLVNNRSGLFSILPLTHAYTNEELRMYRSFTAEATQRWIPLWFQANPRLYIERRPEELMHERILDSGVVSIRGARQTGKTALLRRLLESAREAGRNVVNIDMSMLREESFFSLDSLLYTIAEQLASQLQTRNSLQSLWNESMGETSKLTNFLEQAMLDEAQSPIVLSLDSIDRIFQCPFKNSFFGMIRAWHNLSAWENHWERFTVIMTYSGAPYQLIDDLTQSPFNVGTTLQLQDFDQQQLMELNRRHGSPLQTPEEFAALKGLIGGHPYLAQRAFHALTIGGQTLDKLLGAAQSTDGPFWMHLLECEKILAENPALRIELEEVISKGRCSDRVIGSSSELEALGFILPHTRMGEARPRCGLYALYFDKKRQTRNADSFFVVGGTLRPDQPSYLSREADMELLRSIRAGHFCYILEPRQTGKSSLLMKVGSGLRDIGYVPAFVDLTVMGGQVTPEQFGAAVLQIIGKQLELKNDLSTWWRAREGQAIHLRLLSFVDQIVLPSSDSQFAIFIDEVGVGLAVNAIPDELLPFIRLCYARRSADARFRRLHFVVTGMADPLEILAGENRELMESGHRIHLDDFSRPEMEPLIDGLGLNTSPGTALLDRVYWWTAGHPYLTQKLCLAAISSEDWLTSSIPRHVDRIANEVFLGGKAVQMDSNLNFIAHYLKATRNRRGILRTYKRILDGAPVPFDEKAYAHRRLRTSGIVKVVDGKLVIRNRVYETAFGQQWIR